MPGDARVLEKIDQEAFDHADRRVRCAQQAELLSKVAVEGLGVTPDVVDTLLLRHGVGHLAVNVTADRVDPAVVVEALDEVAGSQFVAA